jgi:hypothetical protein
MGRRTNIDENLFRRLAMPNDNSENEAGNGTTLTDMPSQSYVGTWNIQQPEFPLVVTALSLFSPIPPIDVTMLQNGMRLMAPIVDPNVYRPWARVQINAPTPAQAPLVIETLILKTTDPEPPVAASSQYIRVVIRNVILPEGTRDPH